MAFSANTLGRRNINHFTLFQTDDALVKALAPKEFELRAPAGDHRPPDVAMSLLSESRRFDALCTSRDIGNRLLRQERSDATANSAKTQVLLERIEVAVAVKEIIVTHDAARRDDRVDGLAHGHPEHP